MICENAKLKMKIKAQALGILKVDAGPHGGRLEFSSDTCVDPIRLIKLIQSQPKHYRFEGATVFKFNVPMDNPQQRFATIGALLTQLAN